MQVRLKKQVKNLPRKYLKTCVTSDRSTSEAEGIVIPTWLPAKAASDQSGDLILALEKYYRRTNDGRAAG